MNVSHLKQLADLHGPDVDVLTLVSTAELLSEIARRKLALSLEIAALNGKFDPQRPIPASFPDTVTTLIKRASKIFQVSEKSIQSQDRTEQVSRARFAIWHILRKEGHSFAAIGLAFKRSHGAVMNGCQRAANLTDEAFLSAIEALDQKP